MKKRFSILLFYFFTTACCSFGVLADIPLGEKVSSLQLTSAVFEENKFIPPEYTAEGKDVSPPLAWKNVPPGTRSFALISDDPDASSGKWVHWILFNIPSTFDHIDAGGKNLTAEVLFGKNSMGNLTYNGPNPPQGVHHYHFTLYALDTILTLKNGATSKQLRKAMEGHILEEVTLTGLYEKKS